MCILQVLWLKKKETEISCLHKIYWYRHWSACWCRHPRTESIPSNSIVVLRIKVLVESDLCAEALPQQMIVITISNSMASLIILVRYSSLFFTWPGFDLYRSKPGIAYAPVSSWDGRIDCASHSGCVSWCLPPTGSLLSSKHSCIRCRPLITSVFLLFQTSLEHLRWAIHTEEIQRSHRSTSDRWKPTLSIVISAGSLKILVVLRFIDQRSRAIFCFKCWVRPSCGVELQYWFACPTTNARWTTTYWKRQGYSNTQDSAIGISGCWIRHHFQVGRD